MTWHNKSWQKQLNDNSVVDYNQSPTSHTDQDHCNIFLIPSNVHNWWINFSFILTYCHTWHKCKTKAHQNHLPSIVEYSFELFSAHPCLSKKSEKLPQTINFFKTLKQHSHWPRFSTNTCRTSDLVRHEAEQKKTGVLKHIIFTLNIDALQVSVFAAVISDFRLFHMFFMWNNHF